MKRMMMMVALAAFLVAALSVSALSAFAAQDLPAGCDKIQGKVVCTSENPPGNSGDAAGDPDPGGTTETTTTTQGNTTNFSPEPRGTGTDCSGPPGRC
jgi:uncharacterized membrane protein